MDLQTGIIPTGGRSMQFIKQIQSFIKRTSGKKATNSSTTHTKTDKISQTNDNVSPYPTINPTDDDYEDLYDESHMMMILKMSNDYAWKILVPKEKFILVNPQELFNYVTANKLMANWSGTGHIEWEALLAYLFINFLKEAELKDLNEIDISPLFYIEMYASGNRKMTAEQVRNLIMPSFKVLKKTSEFIYVWFITA